MTPHVLTAAESALLDSRLVIPDAFVGPPVLDERGHVGIERMTIDWTVLRGMPPAMLDEAMSLLEQIAAMPHVEVYEQRYPEALGIIRRGRPCPAITRVTNPAPRASASGYHRDWHDATAQLFAYAYGVRGGKSSLFGSGFSPL